MADPHLPSSCSAPQVQLKQLQEILGSLSLQEEKARVSQHHLDQQLNNEAQQSSSLVAQLQAMVAEREAKVQRLELEIGQLSMQVRRAPAPPSTHFLCLAGPCTPQRLLSPALRTGCGKATGGGGRASGRRKAWGQCVWQ